MHDDVMIELIHALDGASGISPFALLVVVLGGLVMGVAPSSLPLFSVVAGYVGGQPDGRGKALTLSAGFVLGMATVDAALGAFFGLLGAAAMRVLTSYLAFTNLVLAALLAVLGLALLRKIRVTLPILSPIARRVNSFGAAFALGVPFGLSTCPACTPMILPILGVAVASGTPWIGAALLFVFGLARGLPLVAVGAAAGGAKRIARLAYWVPTIEHACGLLLILAAAYFLYQSAVYALLVPPLRFLM